MFVPVEQIVHRLVHHEMDRYWKWYLAVAAIAHIRFILGRDELFNVLLKQGVSILDAVQLNTEFPLIETIADMVYLVTFSNGFHFYLTLEIQSTFTIWMKHRSAEYGMHTISKYHHKYGDLPIFPVVFFLFDDDKTAGKGFFDYKDPFQRRKIFGDPLFICLKSIPRAEIEALGDPQLYPMMMLTSDPLDAIIVEKIFADLDILGLRELKMLAYTTACWAFDKRGQVKELNWLKGKYDMKDMLLDSPPVREALAEDRKKQAEEFAKQAQKREEEFAKQKEEQVKQAKKEKDELAKQAKKEKDELVRQKDQEFLIFMRQTVVKTVEMHFPTLVKLANKMVKTTENRDELSQVQLQIAAAPDLASAEKLLHALGEENEVA